MTTVFILIAEDIDNDRTVITGLNLESIKEAFLEELRVLTKSIMDDLDDDEKEEYEDDLKTLTSWESFEGSELSKDWRLDIIESEV